MTPVKIVRQGFPQWPGGQDPVLPLWRARVQSLVKDPMSLTAQPKIKKMLFRTITTGVGATAEGERQDSTPKTQGRVRMYSKEADGGGGHWIENH